MRVLFVVSGNSKFYKVAPFIKAQGDSLEAEGVEITYFPVEGKGVFNYIKSALRLRKYLQNNRFDLLHAHYSLCGWVAVFAAGKVPVVLSLMGDDAQGTFRGENKLTFKSHYLRLFALGAQPFVRAIITKSPKMEQVVYRKDISHIIPNGVRLEQFQSQPGGYREELCLAKDKRYVLFLANPADVNKNQALVKEALAILDRPDVGLKTVFGVSHEEVVKYLNSADVFVLCSFSEGSPNVVKEAMACNCPMVATNVGDVAWVIGDTPGCYMASFEAKDFAEKIGRALDFTQKCGRTQGRERIIELGLDAQTVARRVISVYQKILAQEGKKHLFLPRPAYLQKD